MGKRWSLTCENRSCAVTVRALAADPVPARGAAKPAKAKARSGRAVPWDLPHLLLQLPVPHAEARAQRLNPRATNAGDREAEKAARQLHLKFLQESIRETIPSPMRATRCLTASMAT